MITSKYDRSCTNCQKKSRPLRKIRYTVCTFECSSLLNNVYSNNGGFYEQNGFDKPLKFGEKIFLNNLNCLKAIMFCIICV